MQNQSKKYIKTPQSGMCEATFPPRMSRPGKILLVKYPEYCSLFRLHAHCTPMPIYMHGIFLLVAKICTAGGKTKKVAHCKEQNSKKNSSAC